MSSSSALLLPPFNLCSAFSPHISADATLQLQLPLPPAGAKFTCLYLVPPCLWNYLLFVQAPVLGDTAQVLPRQWSRLRHHRSINAPSYHTPHTTLFPFLRICSCGSIFCAALGSRFLPCMHPRLIPTQLGVNFKPQLGVIPWACPRHVNHFTTAPDIVGLCPADSPIAWIPYILSLPGCVRKCEGINTPLARLWILAHCFFFVFLFFFLCLLCKSSFEFPAPN